MFGAKKVDYKSFKKLIEKYKNIDDIIKRAIKFKTKKKKIYSICTKEEK